LLVLISILRAKTRKWLVTKLLFCNNNETNGFDRYVAKEVTVLFGSAVLFCLLQNQGQAQAAMGHDAAAMMSRGVPTVVSDTQGVAPHPYVQVVRVRRFEDRFNKLVRAVEEFSQAYNGAKGQVWPAGKAEALRKAMAQLQDADPSLSAKK
jgi:hypothetical protein